MTRLNDENPDLSEEAAEWLIKLDSDALSAGERADFKLWHGKSAAHRQAYAQAEQLWKELDSAVVPSKDSLPKAAAPRYLSYRNAGERSRLPARPRRIALGSMATLCIGLLAIFSSDLFILFNADFQTATGAQRSVTLADGSTLHLNTDSALAVNISSDAREITLLKGEALFEVAPGATRAFRVLANGGASTALGTEFIVRNTDGDVTVTVLESRVAVSYPAAYRTGVSLPDATLTSAQQLGYSETLGLGQVRRIDPRTATAWRRGKIIFENQRLGKVIAELNRYHPGHIQIVDPQVRDLRVNGVFSTSNPMLVIDALERALPLKSTRLTRHLTLLHR